MINPSEVPRKSNFKLFGSIVLDKRVRICENLKLITVKWQNYHQAFIIVYFIIF